MGHLKLLNGDLDRVLDFAEPLPPSVALFVLSILEVPEPLLPDTFVAIKYIRFVDELFARFLTHTGAIS